MLNHESLRKQMEKVAAKQNEWFAKSIEQAEAKDRQNAEEQPRHYICEVCCGGARRAAAARAAATSPNLSMSRWCPSNSRGTKLPRS